MGLVEDLNRFGCDDTLLRRMAAAIKRNVFMTTEQIAQVAHEANRAYCATIGDTSQLPWSDAPAWQKKSAITGVEGILAGSITKPGEAHASWLREKIADGWRYGPEKNPDQKLHPCCVPFEELPREQRAKDAIFFGLVHACIAFALGHEG